MAHLFYLYLYTKDKIIREVRRKPTSSSTRNLIAHNNMSKNTAYSVLKEKYFIIVPTEKNLTLMNNKKKVKFCKNMLKRKEAPID